MKSVAPKSLCKICGSEAIPHLQYGVTVCSGCRSFFRRIVANQREPKACLFNYGGPRRCDITPKKRSICPYCRFQKCLEVGMLRDRIITEVEKEDRKRKNQVVKSGTRKKGKVSFTEDKSTPCPEKEIHT